MHDLNMNRYVDLEEEEEEYQDPNRSDESLKNASKRIHDSLVQKGEKNRLGSHFSVLDCK